MTEEHPGGDEGTIDDDDLTERTGRAVLDASAWTEQRGTDDRSGVVQTGQKPPRSASEAVLDALAAWYGTSKLDLDPPLYESIDPDALDSILECPTGHVEFGYRDTTVTVDHEQNVSVSGVSAE